MPPQQVQDSTQSPIDLSAGFVPKGGGAGAGRTDIDISSGLVPKGQASSQSDTGFLAGLKRGVSNLAGLPGAAYRAYTTPPGTSEEQAVYAVGGPAQLALHRMVVAPSLSELEKSHAAALPPAAASTPGVQQPKPPEFGEASTTGHWLWDQTLGRFIDLGDKTAGGAKSDAQHLYQMHAIGATPLVGPPAADLTQRFLGIGEHAGQPDKPGAAAELATYVAAPEASRGALGAAGAALSGAKGLLSPPAPILKAATAPAHVEALTGFLKTTKTDPHVTATTALPEARAQASQMGVDPAAFKGRAGGEKVIGKEGVFHKAIQAHQAEYAAIRQPHESVPLDTSPIAQAYLDRITPEMQQNEPQMANRLKAQAEKFATVNARNQITGVKPQPLSQVDAFRQRLNNELDAYYQKSPDAQSRAEAELQADRKAVDASRDLVYKTLSQRSGVPEEHIRDIQQRQGALIEARRDLTKALNDASGEQGAAVSKTLREKVAGTYPSPRGVEHKVIAEVLGPKPLTVFNSRLQKMFEGLPKRQVEGGGQVHPPPTPKASLPSSSPPATGPVSGPPPAAAGSQITPAHAAAENAFYTQARAELGANAPPSAVLQRAQQLKLGAQTGGGHAGGGASSVEELSRSGQNYVVRPSGALTYHGKSFAPESTPSGASHVTVLPSGELRVNAGPTLNPAQELALRQAARPQVQQPRPPTSPAKSISPQTAMGPEREAHIASVMDQLKRGEITQQQADARIQRLTGGGGRKLTPINQPKHPGGK